MFRKTTMRRAIAEAIVIYSAGQLLAMVPPNIWPGLLDPIVLPLTWTLRLALTILPPVWAAMRVVSTRREKMSRRFWWLGPRLALFCTLAGALIALLVGESNAFGPTSGPDISRLFASGHHALSPLAFFDWAAGDILLAAHLLYHCRGMHPAGEWRLSPLYHAGREGTRYSVRVKNASRGFNALWPYAAARKAG